MIAMRISSREFCQMPKENLRGKVVVFPTDTVYGIGALLDDPDGIAKIYRIKPGRTKAFGDFGRRD